MQELLSVEVRQGREPECSVTDQLGEGAARPKGNEWPEDGVLNRADQQLDPAAHHRLDEKRRTDSLRRLANRLGIAKVDSYAPTFGLVRTRFCSLDDDRISELVGRDDGVFHRPHKTLGHERQSVGREESARAIGIEPALGTLFDERSTCASIDVSKFRDTALRPAQPLRTLCRPPECARRRFRVRERSDDP